MTNSIGKIRIDIGCGEDPAPGYIGLDVKKTSKAQVIAKLPHLPFKNNSIDGFRARHVMEHFFSEQIFANLRAIARCLKTGGEFLVIVPHGTNPAAFQLDHKSFWSYNSPLTLIVDGLHDEWIGSHYRLAYRRLFWMRREYRGRFPLLVRFMNWMINQSPLIMERLAHWYGGIYEMEFKLIKIT